MTEKDPHIWHWQPYGTPWKGVAIYHVSFSVGHSLPDRQLLGKLVIPQAPSAPSIPPASFCCPSRERSKLPPSLSAPASSSPSPASCDIEHAYIDRSELGKDVVRCIAKMSEVFPQIRLLRYTVMETHVHFIIHVTEQLPVGIQEVMRRFWRSCQKEACLLISPSMTLPEHSRFVALPGSASELPLKELPIFPDAPFLRPLSRKGQLAIMMRYVEKNPARLATKRVYKEYLQTMRDVEVAGRRYDAVGNMAILLEERARTVHVHMRWSDEYRDTGRCEALRTYKNECVLDSRDGVVLVSPYVNPHEKQVLEVALAEGRKAIVILTHGMTDYYQPAERLREACANGQVLILTPWSKEQQEDVGRCEFVRLNGMADEIVGWYGHHHPE